MKNSEKKEKIIITDNENLNKLYPIMHDEHFCINDVKYDSSKKILNIPFDRIHHGIDNKVVKKYFIIKKFEIPVLRCLLQIMNVDEYTLVDTYRIVHNSFNTIKFQEKENLISIDTNIPTQFQIKVSSLFIEYSEICFEGKAHTYGAFFFDSWATGPKFITNK